jgi:hypothetical protein
MPLFANTDSWDVAYVIAARDMLIASLLLLSSDPDDRRAAPVWTTLGLVAWKKVIRELAG